MYELDTILVSSRSIEKSHGSENDNDGILIQLEDFEKSIDTDDTNSGKKIEKPIYFDDLSTFSECFSPNTEKLRENLIYFSDDEHQENGSYFYQYA